MAESARQQGGGAALRVLIVDDEPLARQGLSRQVAALDGCVVVGACGDGRAALEALVKGGVDLVLLDIEMPELDGFGVLAAMGREAAARPPAVVFVTAFDAYAVRAFEAHALDYLLKPVEPARLGAAIERARLQLEATRARARLAELKADLEGSSARPQCIAARSGQRTLLLPVDDVEWLQAADNYVRLHFGGRTALHRATLTELETRLDPARFVRIHRSHVVQLSRVREWRARGRGDAEVWLEDGTRLAVSRRYRAAFEQALASTL